VSTEPSGGPVLSETPEEVEYELRAAEGALWTGSRLLIGAVAFLFASLAFAYFYLRSANNEDLWRPHDVTASTNIGAAIFVLTLVAGALLTFGNFRFHPTGGKCSDTPRGPSWARIGHPLLEECVLICINGAPPTRRD